MNPLQVATARKMVNPEDFVRVPHEVIRRIVDVARRSPSGDNCQPWQFCWDGQYLDIHHDAVRAAHWFDHELNASLLSLGCLLEHIALAASGESLMAYCQYLESGSTDGKLPLARITFTTSSSNTDPLLAAVADRYTERRPFRPGRLPVELMKALQEEAEAKPDIKLYLLESPPGELLSYCAKADELVAEHEPVHRDLMRLVRSRGEKANDGMPEQTLGFGVAQLYALRICRNFAYQRLFNKLGALKIVNRHTYRLLKSSSLIGVLAVSSPGHKTMVGVGRLYQRLWLHLTRAGFAFQPLTTSTLMPYSSAMGTLPSDTPDRFRILFQNGNDLLRRSFGIAKEQQVVWGFRTGLAVSRPLCRTPRREVDDLLEILKTNDV